MERTREKLNLSDSPHGEFMQMVWIETSTQLPELNTFVLIDSLRIAKLVPMSPDRWKDGMAWQLDSKHTFLDLKSVVYWMPLPEPPKTR